METAGAPRFRQPEANSAESADDTQTRLLTEIRDAVGGRDSSKPVAPVTNPRLTR